MAKSEMEEITQKTLEKGGLLANLYFDMQGPNADSLQPLMADLINEKLLKTPGVVFCVGSIEEPLKVGEAYSTSAIVTLLAKDIGTFITIIFNFAPAGIEILKPEHEYRLQIAELQSIMLQLSQVSMDYSEFILKKVLKPEDFENLKTNIEMREKLGKKLLEKKDDKPK